MSQWEGDCKQDSDAEDGLKRLADFLFEVGMLRKTPRSGFQFLGTGKESVAEHSYRTAIIAYLLANRSGASRERTLVMALFHDLHESRVGDFNYVNKMYNTAQERQALRDALNETGLEGRLLEVMDDLENSRSREADLVQDADQLDLILSLKEEQDLGNPYAPSWLHHALKRLKTECGIELAEAILQTDHTDWWFSSVDSSWWSSGNNNS